MSNDILHDDFQSCVRRPSPMQELEVMKGLSFVVIETCPLGITRRLQN